MQPNSRKLLGLAAKIHLFVKEPADGLIVERDAGAGYLLFDREKIRHEEQIVRCGNPKPPDLILGSVPEVQKLGPRRRAEP